jgi:hypothetical protein
MEAPESASVLGSDDRQDTEIGEQVPDAGRSDGVVMALSVLAGLGSVVIVGAMLWFSRYGLEFTDEGYYLVWLSHPELYDASASQFGFVYHPLFELLGSDIARARQANILLTFGLAWVLSDTVLRTMLRSTREHRWQRVAASSALATSSLLVFVLWLLTPNYNTLALQAVCVTAIGLLHITESGRKNLAGWVMTAAGGALTFLAKPTTAAVLGVLVVLCIVVSRRFRLRPAALGAAVVIVLLAAFALAVDGSVQEFVHRLERGSDLAAKLEERHTLAKSLRLDPITVGWRLSVMAALIGLLVFALVNGLRTSTRLIASLWVLLAGVLAVLGFALVHGHVEEMFGEAVLQRVSVIFAVPFAAMLIGVFAARVRGLAEITVAEWSLAAALMLIPYAYACGTNQDYWRVGATASVFWVLGGLVLLVPLRSTRDLLAAVLPLGIATQLMTAGLLYQGAQTPYRQPGPVQDLDTTVSVGPSGSKLIVDQGLARYLDMATRAIREAGFTARTPMIDMTGRSPTLLFAVDAASIDQAWTLGGYEGSEAVEQAALRLTPCASIARAWILLEAPKGPRRLHDGALDGLGLDIDSDYKAVAQWTTAPGLGGFEKVTTQQLLEPQRSVGAATAACRAARGGPADPAQRQSGQRTQLAG